MSTSQVFDHLSVDGSGLIKWNSQVSLLDEFRIMVVHNNFPDAPELAVFNTLVPQGHPKSLRLFKLPQKYIERTAYVLLDRDRSLGMVNRDGHLIVDPSQAVLIVNISPTFWDSQVSLVLRTQSLVEHERSTHTDARIPWDEWGRGAVVMENPNDYGSSTAIIHGAHVLVLRDTYRGPRDRYRIHAFDFTRRGSSTLPLSDENDGATERKVVFNDGQGCAFDGGHGMNPWGIQSPGDSIPFSIVSPLLHWGGYYELICWLGHALGLYIARFGYDVNLFSRPDRCFPTPCAGRVGSREHRTKGPLTICMVRQTGCLLCV